MDLKVVYTCAPSAALQRTHFSTSLAAFSLGNETFITATPATLDETPLTRIAFTREAAAAEATASLKIGEALKVFLSAETTAAPRAVTSHAANLSTATAAAPVGKGLYEGTASEAVALRPRPCGTEVKIFRGVGNGATAGEKI